jgi:hypothetical protein
MLESDCIAVLPAPPGLARITASSKEFPRGSCLKLAHRPAARAL